MLPAVTFHHATGLWFPLAGKEGLLQCNIFSTLNSLIHSFCANFLQVLQQWEKSAVTVRQVVIILFNVGIT